jgi:2,4-dienoyl-CoA reductase [(3E)-enoyl-CoA-producing], peroxisomal
VRRQSEAATALWIKRIDSNSKSAVDASLCRRTPHKNMDNKIFVDGILKGRVAFVTGGGTGITGGVARAFAEAGANVALVSRKLENLEPAAKAINDARAGGDSRRGSSPTVMEGSGEAFAVAADVRNPDEVEKAIAATVERFGKIDIVVNGAAGNFLSPAEALSPNGFGTVVDIDLKGTFNVCRAAFAQLKEHRGQILNISATLHYLGTPMQLHVSAAKAGVDALTRNLAVEWGRYGIRVNGIAPGPIEDTEGMKRLVPELVKEKLKKNIPLGRFGRINDIEKAALFLCSDAASFINGAMLVVDGGQWLSATKFM